MARRNYNSKAKAPPILHLIDVQVLKALLNRNMMKYDEIGKGSFQHVSAAPKIHSFVLAKAIAFWPQWRRENFSSFGDHAT